jgi:threonyl-tRNA synthetase
MEEAKKRDHRALGKKLDLFSIQEARVYNHMDVSGAWMTD